MEFFVKKALFNSLKSLYAKNERVMLGKLSKEHSPRLWILLSWKIRTYFAVFYFLPPSVKKKNLGLNLDTQCVQIQTWGLIFFYRV